MRVFVLGDVNMDLVAFVDHFPTVGEDVRAGGYANTPGGGGLNVAVAYSKLDDQAPYLISCVGADYIGDQIVHRLSQIGISSSYISRSPGAPTGQILVILSRGNGAAGRWVIPSPISLPHRAKLTSQTHSRLAQSEHRRTICGFLWWQCAYSFCAAIRLAR